MFKSTLRDIDRFTGVIVIDDASIVERIGVVDWDDIKNLIGCI